MLVRRAGTELYVRDLALALRSRGQEPTVYTSRIGAAARELQDAGVPIVEDLAVLSSPPDIIHGHHHVETMTALLHFREVPAVFFCHGWRPWDETPPSFPRILRYVGVDDACRDRLWEHGLDKERVQVILNFVDLERFRPRDPLPPHPVRALVFSNEASDSTHLPVVSEACARAGIKIDVAGKQSGQISNSPEQILGGYDLVFAKARCALEAMAVGTAVVLCDASGAGPMVTSDEVVELRRLNFGIRTLRNPLDVELLSREIARYDARDAAEVSKHIRAAAGREAAVDQIVALYQEVLSEHRRALPPDVEAEARATAAYVRWAAADMREARDLYERELEAFEGWPAVRFYKRWRDTSRIGQRFRPFMRWVGR